MLGIIRVVMGRLEVGVLGTVVWVIEEWVRAVQVMAAWVMTV